MRSLTVVYHYEDGSWWAETDEVPGFVAGAATFEETRTLTHEGLEFEADDTVELDERFDAAALAARQAALTITSPIGIISTTRSRGGFPLVPRAAATPSRPAVRQGAMASSRP